MVKFQEVSPHSSKEQVPIDSQKRKISHFHYTDSIVSEGPFLERGRHTLSALQNVVNLWLRTWKTITPLNTFQWKKWQCIFMPDTSHLGLSLSWLISLSKFRDIALHWSKLGIIWSMCTGQSMVNERTEVPGSPHPPIIPWRCMTPWPHCGAHRVGLCSKDEYPPQSSSVGKALVNGVSGSLDLKWWFGGVLCKDQLPSTFKNF